MNFAVIRRITQNTQVSVKGSKINQHIHQKNSDLFLCDQ